MAEFKKWWSWSGMAGKQSSFPPGLPVISNQLPLNLRLSSAPPPEAATAVSPFFRRLPRELRRLIYLAAFGDRTVHIDLKYCPPRPSKSQSARAQGQYMVYQSASAVPDWLWWSSLCHRHWSDEAWRDDCRSGVPSCSLCTKRLPAEVFVGAVNWLLTCRQAYLEAFEVLYNTNTFHISNRVLMRHFPLLVLPGHLHGIRSLELVWNINLQRHSLTAEGRHDNGNGVSTYKHLISALPTTLENLRKLYLHIDTGFPAEDEDLERVDLVEELVLAPIDVMVAQIGPQLKSCEIGLNDRLFRAFQERAEADGVVSEYAPLPDAPITAGERFWRRVARGGESIETSRLGYWVRIGKGA